MAAASHGKLDVVRRLVDHGADVNVRVGGYTALMWAVSFSKVDCVEYLLARGAETSGIVEELRVNWDETRIICKKNSRHLHRPYEALGSPRIVRMLLAKGVVLTTARLDSRYGNKSLEELAQERAAFYKQAARERRPGPLTRWENAMGFGQDLNRANSYAEAADILAGTRLAGHSYKRWVLKDYMALLRLRSLLSRGRARHGPETTVVAARLFGSLNGFAGLPGDCFWLVVKYAWLGD